MQRLVLNGLCIVLSIFPLLGRTCHAQSLADAARANRKQKGAAPTKVLTGDVVQSSDVVITMGCGDACPYFPGLSYRDWQLDDPAGQPLPVVRRIRDDIAERVRALVDELLSTSGSV